MELEILLTTMNKTKNELIELVHSLNIQSKVTIGNQCDEDEVYEIEGFNFPTKVICSTQRGCSNNRNNLFKNSTSDLLLFADDDQVFVNGYYRKIINAFNDKPEAEAIYFNVEVDGKERNVSAFKKGFEKASFKDVSPYGVWGLVIKKKLIQDKNIEFNPLFGPGSKYPTGEDSLYLKSLFNNNISFYRNDSLISIIKQTNSSWFNGFDNRYFTSQGACLAAIYGKHNASKILRSALWHKKYKKVSLLSSIKYLCKGKKEYIKYYD